MERHLNEHDVLRTRRAITACVMTVALVLAGLLTSVSHAGHTYFQPPSSASTLDLSLCSTSQEVAALGEVAREASETSGTSGQDNPDAPAAPDNTQRCLNGICAFGSALAVTGQTIATHFSAPTGIADVFSARSTVQPRTISLGDGYGSRAPPSLWCSAPHKVQPDCETKHQSPH